MALPSLVNLAVCINFPFETIQLTDAEIATYPPIAFGNLSEIPLVYAGPTCKLGPDRYGWPSGDEWAQLNATLNGSLLKPSPPAAVFYPGTSYDATICTYLLTEAATGRFYANDPVTILTQWPQGNTCPLSKEPLRECTQGGFPVYVVNITTVKHVQTAVNFA